MNFILNLCVEEARQASCFCSVFFKPARRTRTRTACVRLVVSRASFEDDHEINSTHGIIWILLWLLCLAEDLHIFNLVNIIVENYLQSQEVMRWTFRISNGRISFIIYYLRSTIAKISSQFLQPGRPKLHIVKIPTRSQWVGMQLSLWSSLVLMDNGCSDFGLC